MNILDENIINNQCQLLRSWRIPFRQIGFSIGRQGLQDKGIISLLHTLRRPTFFTRDDVFMVVIYVTRGIVWSTYQSGKTKVPFLCAAFYIIKNLIAEPNGWVRLFVFLMPACQSGVFTHKNKFALVGRIKQKLCYGKGTQYKTLNLFGKRSTAILIMRYSTISCDFW